MIGNCILIDMVVKGSSSLLNEEVFEFTKEDDLNPFLSCFLALIGLPYGLWQPAFEVVLHVRTLQQQVALPCDGFRALCP